MVSLPKRDPKHVIGEKAVDLVKRQVPDGWVVREQSHDYGIDLEIEVAAEEVTGFLIKAQVKGHSKVSWNQRGEYSQSLSASHLEYWAKIQLPVVLLVPVLKSGTVHWCPANGRARSPGEKSLVVSRTSAFSSVESVLGFARGWMSRAEIRDAVLAYPMMQKSYERLLGWTGRSPFSSIDGQEYDDLFFLYQYVVRVRRALKLDVSMMFPWSVWVGRSERVEEYEGLWTRVFDEVVAFLEPLLDDVRGAVSAAAHRREDPEYEDYWAVREFLRGGGGIGTEGPGGANLSDVEWRKIEKALDDCGAKKFSIFGDNEGDAER